MGFCPCGGLSPWAFVPLGFCLTWILSPWAFVPMGFCPPGFLSSLDFVRLDIVLWVFVQWDFVLIPSMRGDGSCFFRSFSYLLTGAQSDHRIVRQAVVEYMTTNTCIFSDLANCEDYPSTSVMALPGEWGTEVEVLAFASMTNTSQCLHSCC